MTLNRQISEELSKSYVRYEQFSNELASDETRANSRFFFCSSGVKIRKMYVPKRF